MGGETKEASLVDSLFPEMFSDQLLALVDRLTLEFIHCRRNFKSCEAALVIEKLQRELFSKLHIEQSEKTEALILETERKLDENLQVMNNLRDENQTLKQKMETEKQLKLESKLNEILDLMKSAKNETFEEILMEMKEKVRLENKLNEILESTKKIEKNETLEQLEEERVLNKNLRDLNKTLEQDILELKEQLDLKNKSLEDITLKNETLMVKEQESNKKLLGALESIKNLGDENDILEQDLIDLGEQLDLKDKILEDITLKNETLIVKEQEINKDLLVALDWMKNLRDKNETLEQDMKLLKEQLKVMKSKSLKDITLRNESLIVEARQSNEELLDARRELISGMSDIMSGYNTNIGVKRMGELDEVTVFESCFERCTTYGKVFDNLQHLLKDPSWHPFRIIKDDLGNQKEILNEDDKMLQSIEHSLGKESIDIKTLKELLIEYNASGHLPLSELWNFEENRKATPQEAIHCIFELLKKLTKEHLMVLIREGGLMHFP